MRSGKEDEEMTQDRFQLMRIANHHRPCSKHYHGRSFAARTTGIGSARIPLAFKAFPA